MLAGGEGGSAEVEVHVGWRVDRDRVDLGTVQQSGRFVRGEGNLESLGHHRGALGLAAPEAGDLPAGGAEGRD